MLTKSDLSQITKIVQGEIESFDKKVNKRFDKLERKLDYAINFLDRDYLKLLERIEKIEEHLNLEHTSV